MRRTLNTIYCLLITIFLLSCTSQPQLPTQTSLYMYRFDPPAFVELSADFQVTKEIPFSVPRDCSLLDIYSASIGQYLFIELSCPNGQTVLLMDTASGSIAQPVTHTDSHFLAWAWDGKSAYLKIDSLGSARIVRMLTNGKYIEMDLTAWTYDLAAKPNTDDFLFTLSKGLGSGSELHFFQNHGLRIDTLYTDQFNYISFARYSPDGKQIAFIKIPDTQTPFTIGELWLMNADGANARKLADADAGHGYAVNWSPDGMRIAFVKRENTENESANQSADSLISNIYILDVASGKTTQITHFTLGRAETPHWSPDGNTLAFNAAVDGRMDVQITDINSGQIRSLITASTCCPAWIRK